ncbi:MAG: penicillin-binding transpeptidase domain-containing protein [Eubacteriales bacterium]
MIPSRGLKIYIIFILLFALTAVRLFYISDGIIYSDVIAAAASQGTADVEIASRRAFIFDRYGEPLAGVPDGYVTAVNCTEIPSGEVKRVCLLLSRASSDSLGEADIADKISDGKMFTLRTSECFSNDWALSFQIYRRSSGIAPHIVGYVNGDGWGVSGVERAYNELLSSDGGSVRLSYSVGGTGRLLGGLPVVVNDINYTAGGGVTLTLDARLQKAAAELGIERGAVICADAGNGELLCCASFPQFETGRVGDYLSSDKGELINRAATAFTPGSVFKLITAAAALEFDSTLRDFTCECDGSRCYGAIAHGKVDMRGALAQSCNQYFSELCERIGAQRVSAMAETLGIGKRMSVSLVDFGQGKIDSSVASNFAIGQGGTLLTPAELTRAVCAMVNGGVLPQLSLMLDPSLDAGGETVISSHTAYELRSMMRSVVDEGIGSAARGDIPTLYTIGGKTASAQSGQFENGEELIHSWFTGYVSRGGRDIVITVLAEGGVGAAAHFANMAKACIKSGYFGVEVSGETVAEDTAKFSGGGMNTAVGTVK